MVVFKKIKVKIDKLELLNYLYLLIKKLYNNFKKIQPQKNNII